MNREFNVWELRLGREDEHFKRVYIAGIYFYYSKIRWLIGTLYAIE